MISPYDRTVGYETLTIDDIYAHDMLHDFLYIIRIHKFHLLTDFERHLS